MDKTVALFGFAGIGMLFMAFVLIPADAGREMNIPPTNAFSKIITDNGIIEADKYNDFIDMRSTDSVKVNMTGHNLYLWGLQSNSTETNSFGTIIINGNSIKATQTNATIIINTQGSLSCTKSGNTFNCKLTAITCPVLQGLKGVDANGNLFCSTI